MQRLTGGHIATGVGLIGLGAWLRWHGLEAMEFKGDERVALDLGLQLLREHPWSSAAPWPSHGMLSSNNVPNAPLFNWVMALFWTIAPGPVGVTTVIATVNAAVLLPLWLWARRHMTDSAALQVLAMAAVSPFMVIHSRKVWAQDLLLPTLVGVLWAVEWIRGSRPWRGAILLVVALLGLTQLHQSGVIAAPLLVLALAWQWRVDRRAGRPWVWPAPSRTQATLLILVTAAFLFFWWPFLLHLASAPPDAINRRPLAESFRPQLLINLLSQVVPRHVPYAFYADYPRFIASLDRRLAYYLALTLGAPLAAYGLWRFVRAPQTIPVLGIWWWLVIAAFTLMRIPSHDFYVLALAPLPVLLAVGGFDGPLSANWQRALHAWRWAYIASLLVLTTITGLWLRDRGGSVGDYGITFEIRAAQSRSMLRLFRGDPLAPEVAFGEVREADASGWACAPAPLELPWIAEHLYGQPGIAAAAYRVCDAWVPRGNDIGYRWTIRSEP